MLIQEETTEHTDRRLHYSDPNHIVSCVSSWVDPIWCPSLEKWLRIVAYCNNSVVGSDRRYEAGIDLVSSEVMPTVKTEPYSASRSRPDDARLFWRTWWLEISTTYLSTAQPCWFMEREEARSYKEASLLISGLMRVTDEALYIILVFVDILSSYCPLKEIPI